MRVEVQLCPIKLWIETFGSARGWRWGQFYFSSPLFLSGRPLIPVWITIENPREVKINLKRERRKKRRARNCGSRGKRRKGSWKLFGQIDILIRVYIYFLCRSLLSAKSMYLYRASLFFHILLEGIKKE